MKFSVVTKFLTQNDGAVFSFLKFSKESKTAPNFVLLTDKQ